MKNPSKNAYFKQLKNGRLKFLLRLYLRYCGRRDARKKIIREDVSGVYLSPFICHEIYLYNVAFQIEEEYFINSTLYVESDSEVFQLQIGQREQMIGKIENDMTSFDNETLDFEKSITILKAKKLELSHYRDKEEKIKELRCCQLYNILQAKISAYWDGVLQVCGEDLKISPIVIIDQLIQGGEHSHESK